MRDKQREDTRKQIVVAALSSIADYGFDAVSTRKIAQRANVSQGLLTYHFKTKEDLWKAAADHIFGCANDLISSILNDTKDKPLIEQQRDLVRACVYFSADYPEFMRFMLDTGKRDNERTQWLVETHVKPIYHIFKDMMKHIPSSDIPHIFYLMIGGGGLMFSVPYVCHQTTTMNPHKKRSIQYHAEMLAKIIVPDRNDDPPTSP